MKNEKITDRYYKEAVKGLDEALLQDKDSWYTHIISLPTHLQVVYTIITFRQQVFNGGFHQYFFNAYGQFAFLTLKSLRIIGAFNTAMILEKALNEVNAEQFTDSEFRERVFNRKLDRITNFDDNLGDTLDDLDSKYYSLNEDLEQLLAKYLESRRGSN